MAHCGFDLDLFISTFVSGIGEVFYMTNKENDHHITPFRVYLVVYISLVILTVATVWISRIDLGLNIINVVVAMLVASVKAMIVILYFMHQKYESTLNRITFFSAFFFLIIFFTLSAMDVFTRDYVINLFGSE